MKKLMITMAVAGSIGLARANLTEPVTFEDLTVGNLLNIMPAGGGSDFEWASTATNTVGDVEGTEVKAYEGEDLENTKYLALDGLDQPLRRYAQAGGEAYEIPEDGIYIDTLVKFTVSEDDAPDAGPGDKLCVWVGVDPVSGATNLMVKAGYIVGDSGAAIPTNYVVTGAFPDGNIEGWHRLTVIAYTGLDEGEWLTSGFAIKIDGNLVGTELCPFETPGEYTFNENVAAYMASSPYKLFPSLISGEDTTARTLTSVGFQGSGSIDNVQFTETDPNPQPIGTYTVSVTTNALSTYTAAYKEGGEAIEPDENNVLTVTVDQTITITATPVEGYEYATTPDDWTAGENGVITIEVSEAGTVVIPEPTQKALGTYEITVTPNAKATYVAAYKTSGDQIEPENNVLTVTDGQTITITVTPSTGYEYTSFPQDWTSDGDGKIYKEFSAAAEVAIPEPAPVWVDPKDIDENASASTQYPDLAGSALAEANAKKLTTWAEANNISFAAVAADTEGAYTEAYLLNCAVADVADEKAEFVLGISFDENGTPVVTTPAGKEYNGNLQLKGKVNLTDAEWVNINAPSTTYKFYMYELSL